MIAFTTISSREVVKTKKPNILNYQNISQVAFLRNVIEELQDGILILTNTGKLIFGNSKAYDFCHQIEGNNDEYLIPQAIWDICKSLIENSSFEGDRNIVSDEIKLNNTAIFRIRVRYLRLNQFHHPYLLVTIENRYESVKNAVITEIKKYQLTSREAEIWHLYRLNYSYKQIAEQLYITINTVKKHMKNIHAKRQDFFTQIYLAENA
ncbi:helix-turn-helix transcriptional regulator [Calothrix sp. UHCC 0171]|uniref:helix-turn-helix transcriptional regulator n=1 Tax=Calothrix sp. UHCC 0171 TaxID=3110245 RepID=UPI002B217C01|nr:LuxR C-terminal-related transcriptional regulator [Calothrix sp. UHCC 0171]MEA5572123.1 LuxR C-terminal-related transcriptional regulator [Calothrix sp. UHCC 0171]